MSRLKNVEFIVRIDLDLDSYAFEYGACTSDDSSNHQGDTCPAHEDFPETREFIREAIDYKVAELMNNWPFITARKVV